MAGWQVAFVPESVAYHQIGATSGKVRGFTTYQTLKNLPLLLHKNIPDRYYWHVCRRFILADFLFFCRAISRGHLWSALKGAVMGKYLILNGYGKRQQVQATKKVSDEYVWNMLVHDLPPNAHSLRRLRASWWKLLRRNARHVR